MTVMTSQKRDDHLSLLFPPSTIGTLPYLTFRSCYTFKYEYASERFLRSMMIRSRRGPTVCNQEYSNGAVVGLGHVVNKRKRPVSTSSNNNQNNDERIIVVPVVWSVVICTMVLLTGIELTYMHSMGLLNQNLFKPSSQTNDDQQQRPVISGGKAIDNYYQRKHIREPVPIIVGGSDGSGTRAFAKLLQHLGILMVIDDEGTLDVHGTSMMNGKGWPNLVTQVLNATHSAYYDVNRLPMPLLKLATGELSNLLQEMEHRALRNSNLNISYGFKAPISQLLLPLFRSLLPKMKFLHIVRDGRDIAVSENKSPVMKFYDCFYVDERERGLQLMEEGFRADARIKIQATQLWNDWNSKVYEYGNEFSDGITFDYLLMRTEDLFEHSFESTLQLADFVGSKKSPYELCCISQKLTNDLGVSDGPGPTSELQRKADGLILEQVKQQQQHANRLHQQQNHHRRLLERGNDDGESSGALVHHQKNEHVQPRLAFPSKKSVLEMEKKLAADRGPKLKSHNFFRGVPRNKAPVEERYGKWFKILESDPKLLERIHREGSKALKMFGYEPLERFMDTKPVDFQCDASVVC
jgi:hypothetical protein